MKMKKCSKCKQIKSINKFYKDKNNLDGFRYECKQCRKVYEQSIQCEKTLKKYQQSPKGKQTAVKYTKTLKGKFLNYKCGAKQRNLKFNLTLKEFENIISQPCFYCGSRGKPYSGIDRIDSKIGYVKDNCVSCCAICNYMKHVYTKKQFLTQIEKIYNYQQSKKQKPLNIIAHPFRHSNED